MQEELDFLLAPEPPPEPPKQKRKQGNPNFKKNKINPYYNPKSKLNKKAQADKKEPDPTPEPPPPPIPVREFTAEEKAAKVAEYKRLRERKKLKNNNGL